MQVPANMFDLSHLEEDLDRQALSRRRTEVGAGRRRTPFCVCLITIALS